MKRTILVILLGGLLAVGGDAHATGPLKYHRDGYHALDKKVAPRLLEVLNQYFLSIKQGDPAAYYSAMSTKMANETKNMRLSLLRDATPTARELKEQYEMMKEIIGPLPIKRADAMIEGGVTAVLVMLRMDKEPGDGMAIFQPFYKERGGWRVGMMKMTGFSGGALPESPIILRKSLPRAPVLMKAKPDYLANYSVNAYHYKVRLTVNGRRIKAVEGGKSESGLLLGGLRRGKNIILVTFHRSAEAPPSSAEVVLLATRSRKAEPRRLEILKETKAPRGKVRRVISLP